MVRSLIIKGWHMLCTKYWGWSIMHGLHMWSRLFLLCCLCVGSSVKGKIFIYCRNEGQDLHTQDLLVDTQIGPTREHCLLLLLPFSGGPGMFFWIIKIFWEPSLPSVNSRGKWEPTSTASRLPSLIDGASWLIRTLSLGVAINVNGFWTWPKYHNMKTIPCCDFCRAWTRLYKTQSNMTR